ncbi:MAG: glycerol-3-phosphate 1-O-acyltransferase PlsY [Rhodobacteraceae bacterium]|nr:glycerol-3-phosphate 1-O-acyltransferase PlsY [Paracoccaceae bacterium]
MPEITTGAAGLALAALIGYLLGSVPFGLLITRALGMQDIRGIGSGNIGATNVLRTGSKGAALATLLLDAGKGAAAVLIARALWDEDAAQLAALAAVLGHLFPVWLGFRGGKGVATFLGVLFALAWPVGLAACLTWLAAVLVTRISSMGALAAATFSCVWAAFLGFAQVALLAATLGALVIWRHLPNIERIKAGTEPRIGRKHK